MKTQSIYMAYDDVAKMPISIFNANTEEQAINVLESTVATTLQKIPHLKYRVTLHKIVNYDPLNISDMEYKPQLIKTFKGGK